MQLKSKYQIALGFVGIAGFAMPSSAGVIFDQIAPVDEMANSPLFLYASQTTAGGLGAASSVAVDDFEVKEGQNVLTQIDALMAFFGGGFWGPFMDGLPSLSGWSVQIYSSKDAAAQSAGNGFAGDVASLAISSDQVSIDIEHEWNQLPTPTEDFLGLVSIDLGELLLPAGQYWITVAGEKETQQPVLNVHGSPQHDGPGESHNAFSVAPSGAITELNNNLAYRIHAIPAPGALALLGLAGIVSSRRRRG